MTDKSLDFERSMSYEESYGDFGDVLQEVNERSISTFFAIENALTEEGYEFSLKGHDKRVIDGEPKKEVFVYELKGDDAVGFCLYREDGKVEAYAMEPRMFKPAI